MHCNILVFFFFFLPLPPTADVDVDGVGGFTRTCASAVRVFYKKWEKGVNFSLPPHCILCAINHEKKKEEEGAVGVVVKDEFQ